MVILLLTVTKRLVSQDITVTTGWVTDDSTTYISFMVIEKRCWLHGNHITYSCQKIGEPGNYSNYGLGY